MAQRSRRSEISVNQTPGGVVGLGLMGSSIATCLLAAGHPLAGVARTPKEGRAAMKRIAGFLAEHKKEGLLNESVGRTLARLTISTDYKILADCEFVVESIIEDLKAKRAVIAAIEKSVSPKTLIGSNTSALPITKLQRGMKHPKRVVGIHWGEPAHINKFMEVICGDETDKRFAARAMALAEGWGKEPALVRRDIRGFITNRIMYAMLREAFFLVESGLATPEDVDRSVRNDYGYWMTFAGPFRFMDVTGIPAYAAVMRELWPELSCAKKVPKLMRKIVKSGALGLRNQRGFFRYTPVEALEWEKKFVEFSYDIRKVATKYNYLNRRGQEL